MKKHIKVISIILCLLIIIVSGTYAFYGARINRTGSSTASVSTKTLSLTFTDGPHIELQGILPGGKVIKTFTVSNTGNTTQTYYIDFIDVINELDRGDDLILSLTSTNNGATLTNVVFPDSDKSITSAITIDPNVTQEYTLTIEYQNIDTNQSIDMNKAISATIQINTQVRRANGEFAYSGQEETYVATKSGLYLLEVWGAEGSYIEGNSYKAGTGGYSSGLITLDQNDVLYVNVGASGNNGGYNGGGENYSSGVPQGRIGGGATDIRVGGNTLYHRVIVAGGGGSTGYNGSGGAGGGLTGDNAGTVSSTAGGYGATQTAGGNARGDFGLGGNGNTTKQYTGSSGGGGWYGGGGSSGSSGNGAGGGSGFVYTADATVDANYLVPSKYQLVAGNTYKSNSQTPTIDHTAYENGHTGDGYAKITYVGTNTQAAIADYNAITYAEYLESPGGIAFDTGYYATEKTKVVAKLYTETTANKNWFGGNAKSSTGNFSFNAYGASKVEYNYGKTSGWKSFTTTNPVVNTDFIIEYGDGAIIIDNQQYATLATTAFTDSYSLYILGRNNGGTVSGRIAGRIYYFKIYEDGVLVHDYAACRRELEIGLCDKIDDSFLSKIGDGDLKAGLDVTN